MSGGGSSGGGGSAGSGEVKYAEYLEKRHQDWLADMDDIIDPPDRPGVGDVSPYEDAEAWNPEENLEIVQRRFDDYDEKVEVLNEVTDYKRFRTVGTTQTNAETRFSWPSLMDNVTTKSDVDDRLDPLRLGQIVDSLRNLDGRLEYSSVVEDVEETLGVQNLLDPEKIMALSRRLVDLSELDLEQLAESTMQIVDTIVFPTEYIDRVMDSREEAEEASMLRARSALSGVMAAQGSVMSSAFVLGHALIMSEYLSRRQQSRNELELAAHKDRATLFSQMLDVAKSITMAKIDIPIQLASALAQILNLRMALITAAVDQVNKLALSGTEVNNSTLAIVADLEKTRYNYLLQAVNQSSQMEVYKLTYINQAVEDMFRMLSHKITAGAQSTTLLAEIKRVTNVSMKEYFDRDVELNVADHNYPLEVWQYAANLLAAIHGAAATYGQDVKNKSPSALGGAISGALTGASLGSIGGPWGAAAGAIIGGAGGAFMK